MIVTGEASGDIHAANLVRALRKRSSGYEFSGMGGPELRRIGVKILFPAEKVSVVGIFEVFSHLPDIVKAQRIIRRQLRNDPPELLILVDLPDFNLLLAKVAKRLGIPVFYYIAPQVWAWRRGRVKTIAKRVDRLGVILPFEEKFFRDRGVEAHYVGHPLLDSVRLSSTVEEFRNRNNIPESVITIGLLPGSRKREIISLLPDFLKSASLLKAKLNEPVIFLVPLAPTLTEADLDLGGLSDFRSDLDIRIIPENRYDMMASCDAVVTASGTVTLELALLQTLMVVTYRLSPMSYKIGRMLVKLPFFSLVNLIAGRQVVPELLQDEVTPERIADELYRLLTNTSCINDMRTGLATVSKTLGERGASERAAQAVIQMIEEN